MAIYLWSAKGKTVYHVYLLRCRDGTLYCGIAKDLEKRVAQHNAGRGSVYVRSRGGGEIVYSEVCTTRSEALSREARIKKMPRLKKEELIIDEAGGMI